MSFLGSKEAEALASAYNTTENQRPGPSGRGEMPPSYDVSILYLGGLIMWFFRMF